MADSWRSNPSSRLHVMQTLWRQRLMGAASAPGPFGGLLKRSAGQNCTAMGAEISRRMEITFRLHLTEHGFPDDGLA
jgi:hypothetical protein